MSILNAAAPFSWYCNGTTSALASLFIHPLEGDLRLNSAIMSVSEASNASRIEAEKKVNEEIAKKVAEKKAAIEAEKAAALKAAEEAAAAEAAAQNAPIEAPAAEEAPAEEMAEAEEPVGRAAEKEEPAQGGITEKGAGNFPAPSGFGVCVFRCNIR